LRRYALQSGKRTEKGADRKGAGFTLPFDLLERLLLADSVEKVGFGFHGRKVRV
jgi:hypothetical protein